MLYLNTSFIAPLLFNKDVSDEVEAFVTVQSPGSLVVSEGAPIEFSSLVASGRWMNHITIQAVDFIITEFWTLMRESSKLCLSSVADYDLSKTVIDQRDSNLRAGKALHLATAINQEPSKVLSLDERLLEAAKHLQILASRGIS